MKITFRNCLKTDFQSSIDCVTSEKFNFKTNLNCCAFEGISQRYALE